MGEEERNCTIYTALLVHEMSVQRFEAVDVYSGLEVWQLIELSFLLPPIEFLSPVCSQSFYMGQGGSIIPAGLIELVR